MPVPPAVPATTPTNNTSESDSSSSSGGNHHNSSEGSGGAGDSPEPAKNVQVKDTAQVFVPSGKQVVFNFKNNVTVVDSISFESKKTMGKISAIAENLKNKSTLVTALPKGEVYKSFNVWVGNAGYGDSDNIKNATVEFKVERSSNTSDISLYKYDKEAENWTELPVTSVGNDSQYLHFKANTPGYSSFVIVGHTLDQKLTKPSAISVVNDAKVVINYKAEQKELSFTEIVMKRWAEFKHIFGM